MWSDMTTLLCCRKSLWPRVLWDGREGKVRRLRSWTMVSQIFRGGLYGRSARSLVTTPWLLPKRVVHRLQAEISSLTFQYLLLSSRSSSSCLRLFPRLLPSNFRSVTWFRRQFLCQTWSVQLAFISLYAVCFLPKIHLLLGRQSETCRHSFLLVYVFCMPLPTADLVHVKYLLEKVNST